MKAFLLSLIFLLSFFTACSDSAPKNAAEAPSQTTSSALSEVSKTNDAVVMQCVIAGKPFKGKAAFNACLFYPNGYDNKVPKNSLTLSFRDAANDNDLHITMTILPFDKKPGTKPSNIIEGLYAGTMQGKSALFGYKQSYKNANFSLEITKVEDKGTTLILSGKFAGKFTNPFVAPGQESPVIPLETGEFSNVEVKIIQ